MGRGALVRSKGGGLLSYIGGGALVRGGFCPPQEDQGGLLSRGAYVLHSGGIKLASQFLWTRKNAHVLK